MRCFCPVLRIVLLILVTSLLPACDTAGMQGGDDGGGSEFPLGSVLVASMDGNEPGLWLFDPVTLKRVAVIDTENRTPVGMAFSPDYTRWYLTWRTGSKLDGTAQNVLAALDPQSGQIVQRTATSDLSMGSSPLIYDPMNDHVVSYGSGVGVPVTFFDAATLNPVHTQSIGGDNSYVVAAAVAENRGLLYFGADTNEPAQIYVYDPVEQDITNSFALTDDPALRRSALSDVAISPDERYLFATTFFSPGGPGRFYMVDLEAGETVFEGSAGSYSNLAVSPNGHYVYIDCPAGGLRNLPPTQQVLRFDVQEREMEVFIDGQRVLDLGDYVLIVDQITMLPDGESFVIENPLPASIKDKENEDPTLVRVNAKTANKHATSVLPRDGRGIVIAGIRELRFGIITN